MEAHGLGPPPQAPRPEGMSAVITNCVNSQIVRSDQQASRLSHSVACCEPCCARCCCPALVQAYLKASSVFRQAGALQQALHAYNGMRRMGVVKIRL